MLRVLGLLALFCSLLAGCGPAKPLSVASHVWPGYEPMHMALAEGWLDSKQIQLVDTASASDSINALLRNEVDAAALTLDETLRVRASGLPVTVVMVFDISAGADALLVSHKIKQLSDLKNKRIGYEFGAVGALVLYESLRRAELSPADVETINIPFDQHEKAWKEGRIDALITFEPAISQLQQHGARVLFDTRDLPNTIMDVLAVRTDKLKHSAALQHLIAAHFKALKHVQTNPQDAAFRLSRRLGLPPDQVMATFKGLLLPDIEGNKRLLQGEPPPFASTAEKLSQLMLAHGMIVRNDTQDQLYTATLLPHTKPD